MSATVALGICGHVIPLYDTLIPCSPCVTSMIRSLQFRGNDAKRRRVPKDLFNASGIDRALVVDQSFTAGQDDGGSSKSQDGFMPNSENTSINGSGDVFPATQNTNLRIFSHSDTLLFSHILVHVGSSLPYEVLADSLLRVMREHGWNPSVALNYDVLCERLVRKLQVVRQSLRKSDKSKSIKPYAENATWYREVEKDAIEQLDKYRAVTDRFNGRYASPARVNSTEANNSQRRRMRSPRTRYSDIEELMIRHKMVSLSPGESLGRVVYNLYEGTRKYDLVKHKCREVRIKYSTRLENGVFVPTYHIDPSGHFDESKPNKWVQGPIPEHDIRAFNERLQELHGEAGSQLDLFDAFDERHSPSAELTGDRTQAEVLATSTPMQPVPDNAALAVTTATLRGRDFDISFPTSETQPILSSNGPAFDQLISRLPVESNQDAEKQNGSCPSVDELLDAQVALADRLRPEIGKTVADLEGEKLRTMLKFARYLRKVERYASLIKEDVLGINKMSVGASDQASDTNQQSVLPGEPANGQLELGENTASSP